MLVATTGSHMTRAVSKGRMPSRRTASWCGAGVVLVTLVIGRPARGEDGLPVVRASSPRVDVQDGNRLLRGIWTVAPEVAVDVYYARRARDEHKVTFRTDIDAISFDVRPGQHYDFVVLLDGTRRSHTRISTLRETCHRDGAPGAPAEDTIPFAIGADHKIHITGRVNESAPLDLLFDMGADTFVLYPSGVAKHATLRIDGKVENAGTGGVATREASNDNRVALGGLRWDHEAVLLIEKQADRADGIVGHNLFEDKVVEIDYDAGVLRIGDRVPDRAKPWTALPIRFVGTLPAVPVRIEGGPEPFDEWLVLDTGSSLGVYLNRGSASKHRLHDAMTHLGTSQMRGVGTGVVRNQVVLLPRLGLGAQELRDLPLHLEELSEAAQEPGGHLGMDVLKRFQTVLDFQNDVIYLAPSALAGTPYRADYRTGRWRIAAAAAAAIVLGAGALWLRRRRVAKRRANPT
jgi:aspartyl protease